ncbi:hypothetical protein [Ornithinimicrobium sp. INDO-MA30-4]|nr:hypothetical protein [Ornithinimicrobium sp. INDO-MA30-4]UJH71692.1 hypothetical protein L0A91_01365 [Ornithinimicrobium sp. INDO-MA30-4]
MTRTLADLAEDCDVAFVHSARSPVDIIAGASWPHWPTPG